MKVIRVKHGQEVKAKFGRRIKRIKGDPPKDPLANFRARFAFGRSKVCGSTHLWKTNNFPDPIKATAGEYGIAYRDLKEGKNAE